MKFEMEIGYIQNEKITVETWDFDKIEIIKDVLYQKEDTVVRIVKLYIYNLSISTY